ncbi:glycosyl hydrolases family 16-domain-containing protein, partial [Blyttiomyces helicus]
GQIVRVATTRWMQYGKFEAKFTCSNVPGAVTTFIVDSSSTQKVTYGDEIDWEIVGLTDTSAQSNLPTYQGNTKIGVFGGTHTYASGVSTDEHTYGIEWTHSAVTWSLDGVAVRTFSIGSGDSIAQSTNGGPAVQLASGQHWFPTTPSPIQVG